MNLKSLIPYYKETKKESTFEFTFTVFTPVYNRAQTIQRVFDSLHAQTFTDFEWIIINDGSTDDSHKVIEQLIKKSTLNITYINNSENKHKMACLVQGIAMAKGKFFLPFDSDDTCVPNALEVFIKTYREIPDKMKPSISGVTCMCIDQYGKPVGKEFPVSPYYSNTFSNLLEGKYNDEKWGFIKTRLLKNVVVNPEIFSKGYIPEGVIWTLFSKLNFKTCYINHALRVYYIEDTNNSITGDSLKNRAFGLMVYSLAIQNHFFEKYFFKNPGLFLKQFYYLLKTAKYVKIPLKDYLKSLDNAILKIAFVLCWPFRFLLHLKP
ncbi:MAG TPA: glycosyltransferase family 2 protein [Flavobacteriaceae bacterium]|nr:glycosyltransferase family 2 protein [Flavobacteriaceae bacterium]